jgi:hypothetical protein
MNNPAETRHCVIVELRWLIEKPTTNPAAGLTCYREELGLEDLFSVFVKFTSPAGQHGPGKAAKIFALVEEMEPRLPPVGRSLILTAGSSPIAVAEVISECDELIR